MSGTAKGWRLQCIYKSRVTSVTITDEQASMLEIIASCLNLVLGQGLAAPNDFSRTDEKQEELASAGLRFPNGWSAGIVLDEDAGPMYRPAVPVTAAPLIPAFPDAQVSRFFRLSEFRPGKHTYEYIRLSPVLVDALDEIRLRAGRPVTVLSGYRPHDYNRECGGVSNSTHIDGLAADIACEGLTTAQLRQICADVIGNRGGVAEYPKSGFVHVDTRGQRARWDGT